MSSVDQGKAGAVTRERRLAGSVFNVLADRYEARAADVALFTETGCSYQAWCVWEAVAACREHGAGWTVRPRPPYATAGVTGSREHADLEVFDPSVGRRLLIELAVIHDWSRNQWIDELDGDTMKLGRPRTPGIVPLQVVLAASLDSPIDVNPVWQQWLGMSAVWNRPTELRRERPLGTVGQLVLVGWVLGGAG